jgi:glucan phosphoethanolaminetransferase (alkaline phosphatase superfamily)
MLVIGESTRASSLQLNGYERETTPLLAQTPGLLSFKNVISPAPATILSVPILLTPTNASTLWEAYRTPSILNVYKAAGYRVYWLSVQPKNGLWESRNTIFSADAHESKFLVGKTSLAASVALDSDLIPEVQKILARGEPKVLFVLHTMGSHLNYEDRYPPEFNRFPADPKVCAQARTHVYPLKMVNEHMRNAYDNTICFTDSVLHQLIEIMAKERGVTSLYYVSDHGENGAEAVVLPWGHGNLTTEVLHVPLLVWLSPEYQAARPRQSAALRDHVELPTSSDSTFHTMLDLAGLSCSLTSPGRSLANPLFSQGPRRVTHMHTGLADYDKDVLPAEKARGGWRPLHPLNSMSGRD